MDGESRYHEESDELVPGGAVPEQSVGGLGEQLDPVVRGGVLWGAYVDRHPSAHPPAKVRRIEAFVGASSKAARSRWTAQQTEAALRVGSGSPPADGDSSWDDDYDGAG